MALPRLCTLLSVFLLCKLPSIHVGAHKQLMVVPGRGLKGGGILKSVEEAWDDTARVSTASVETRCRKPSRRLRRLKTGSKGSKEEYTGNALADSKGMMMMGMSKSKKTKSSKGDVPYCDDDDLSQTAVTSPTPVPNNSEEVPTNGGPAAAPSPTSVDDRLPTNGGGPAAAPSPTTPVDSSILRDCDAIAAGTARTDGSNQSFEVNMSLIIDGSVPLATILSELQRVLQLDVAPVLAGCLATLRRRRLQEATYIYNVLFGTPEAVTDATCTSALADTEANTNLSCLKGTIGTGVYYTGNDPEVFLEALRAAIAARGNFGINGLLSILGPQVTQVDSDDGTGYNGDGTGTGTNGDGTGTGTNGDGTGTGYNGDGTGTDTNGDGIGTGTNGDGTGTGTNGDGTGTGTNGDGTGTGTNGDGTGTGTNGDDTGTGTDGDGTGTNGNGTNVSGVQGTDDSPIGRGSDGVPVGTTIGVTAAGLALVLLVLLFAGRRRRRTEAEKVEEVPFVHRVLTDEDESYTRDMDASAYDKNIAQIVSEDDDDSVVIRWGETGDQGIYSQPIESTLKADDMQFMEGHSCSSPSCKICARRAEEGVGVQFIPTPKNSNARVSLSRDSRNYLSNDTVDL